MEWNGICYLGQRPSAGTSKGHSARTKGKRKKKKDRARRKHPTKLVDLRPRHNDNGLDIGGVYPLGSSYLVGSVLSIYLYTYKTLSQCLFDLICLSPSGRYAATKRKSVFS